MSMLFSRANTNPLARWWWQTDHSLLWAFAALMVIGIVLVGAAGSAVANRIDVEHSHFFVRHMAFLAVGIFAMLAVSLQKEKTIRRGALIVFILAVIACVAAQFLGADVKGAKRWLYLGPFTLQPSEFLKPSFFIISAWLLSLGKKVTGYWGLAISVGLWMLCVALLMIQPDLGMTVVVTAVWSIQIFLAGLPLWVIAAAVPIFAGGLLMAYLTLPHVASRFNRFLDSGAGDTYQVDKSLEAFANGGWFGAGPGHGEVVRHLPDAHTDFIFSVAAEETGLLGVLLIICIYVFVIRRSLNSIRNCNNMFVALTIVSLAAQFGFQAIVHMCSSLELLPAKGMTLPFVSYGGSSTLSIGMIAGVLLAFSRREVTEAHSARPYVANPSIPKKPE